MLFETAVLLGFLVIVWVANPLLALGCVIGYLARMIRRDK